MGKATGFLEYVRKERPKRPPEERLKDFAPFQGALSERSRRRQGGRCMDCGVPFCQAGIVLDGQRLGCPLHNLIPEWNDLIFSGNEEQALSRLIKTNCFPEFTGRVCPALCERACVCGMIGAPVTVRDNELSIIEYAFENDLMTPCPPTSRSGKRIAVVGSGPAGLAAAYYLNRRGHSVTVFERDLTPGGLLTYGIPAMKLPKSVVKRRVSLMEQEGVQFRTGRALRAEQDAEMLTKGFDLTIFCCGAQAPREMAIAEHAGVFYALDYLHATAAAQLGEGPAPCSAAGKDVVIVGAGDSASDCLATALRQGCRSVLQLIRKPAAYYGDRSDYAHEEAEFRFGCDIRRFETEVCRLQAGGSGGLASVTAVSHGEETELPCQLLLLASGYSGCEADSLALAEACEAAGGEVIRAGDMAAGSSLVVLAIADGKRAAAEADRRLMGYTNIL